MPLLRLPEPYDFALSTERFRALGPDLANLWHEGGAAPRRRRPRGAHRGGARRRRVEPLDAETRPVVRKLLGARVRPRAFCAWARRRPGARAPRRRRSRLPPAARARPVRDAGHLDHGAAGLAPRGVRDPQPVDRALRRRGRARRTRSRPPSGSRARARTTSSRRLLRRKAEYVVGLARADLDLDELAPLPDEEVKARLVASAGLGEWTADWFLARHLARPRAWPAGDLGLRKAVLAFYGGGRRTCASRRALRPFQNLTAHYLLTGSTAGAAVIVRGDAGRRPRLCARSGRSSSRRLGEPPWPRRPGRTIAEVERPSRGRRLPRRGGRASRRLRARELRATARAPDRSSTCGPARGGEGIASAARGARGRGARGAAPST